MSNYSLQEFLERAQQAYRWTSMSPEKRGITFISDCESDLKEDIEELKAKEVSGVEIERYISGFRQKVSAWIGAKSNCISSFIAGPSNFPVRRAEKANNREHAKSVDYYEWRKKVKKRLIKRNRPEVNEFEEVRKNLAQREALKALMVFANKEIRKLLKSGKTPEEQVQSLSETCKIDTAQARKLLTRDSIHGFGYPSYAMQNNNQMIAHLRERVKILEHKEAKSEAVQTVETPFQGGKIIVDYTLNRVQIQHDAKPERQVLDTLRKNGFKWAPSQKAWQRVITSNAMYAVQNVTGLKVTF